MKKGMLFVLSILFVLSGCDIQKEVTRESDITTLYTVDEFVEKGFKESDKAKIQIKSVTCYNNSCGVEGGGRWGIGMNAEDSKVFYPFAGQAVDMIIEASPDCPKTGIQCNKIKNVSIVQPADL